MLGVCHYTVMPFVFQNADIIYQRAKNITFCEHLCKMVECHVDDLVIEGRKKDDHFQDLKMIFDIVKKYYPKINSTKSFMRVSS